MRSLRRFFRRLGSWVETQRAEERLQAEIEEHLALLTAENLGAGLPPAEARRQALLQFGGVEAMKQSYREQRGLPLLDALAQDARYALRRLRMAPAFTAATVLTLALGIGATTAIFTLVHAVLLQSLPVADPAALYRLGRESRCCYTAGYSQEKEFSLVSYDLYRFLRDNTHGFAELAAFPAIEPLFGVRRAGTAEAAQSYPGEFVSGNYFRAFGITAYAGRALIPGDDRPGAPPVAVMSYRLWREAYAGDPSVVGSAFLLDGKPFTVVGVTPPGFFSETLRSTPPDFYLPLNTEPFVEADADLNKYDTHWLNLIGRILPGLAPAAVEAEMRVRLKQWLQAHWNEMSPNDRIRFPEQTLYLVPGGAGITSMRERYEHWLKILMAVTGFVLLIVCANVANLMLVRSLERRRQTALSMALGAQLSRVLRAPLMESVLLSLGGGAAGLAIALAGTRLILNFTFPAVPGLGGVPIDAAPSMPVLWFAFLISLATGVAFGVAPAVMAARVDPIEALRGSGRATARMGGGPRKTLVVLQAALSLVLLSASGLLTAALQKLQNQDLGFELDRRIVIKMNPRLAGYHTAQLPVLYRRIREALAAVPGVASVAICFYSPLTGGGSGSGVWVAGAPPPGPRDRINSSWDRVTAGYFDVIGTPVLEGRGLTNEDTAESRKVAVISEAFARKFFRKQDPIGQHFGRRPELSHEFEVVGVVKDARYREEDLEQPIGPYYFLPEAQAEYERTDLGSLFLKDIVIVSRPGTAVAPAQLRRAMASVDPNLPLVSIHSLREQVSEQFRQQRLIARLTSLFGILSLVLASIGLYGVTAYNASRRSGEMGVRMALGANRGDVVRLVLRGAFGLILGRVAVGAPVDVRGGAISGESIVRHQSV